MASEIFINRMFLILVFLVAVSAEGAMVDRSELFVSEWKKIESIEKKIESTSRMDQRDGFFVNMFGEFDRRDLTQELLATYSDLLVKAPDSIDVKYRFAGALMRANRLSEAQEMYGSIIEESLPANLMLAMVQLMQGDRGAAQKSLAIYNERCIKEGMPFLQSSMEKIAVKNRRDQ